MKRKILILLAVIFSAQMNLRAENSATVIYGKWENFVTSREMKGVQLFAGDKGNKELAEAYKIVGIPRFVLVGKDGNIASPDAPRPSSPEIKLLLDSLLK